MIELRMLGEIQLWSSEGVAVDTLLRQPKRLALLAYLATPNPGTWHRRDMLLALFWPELDTAHARTSLRNAVYFLRQNLGDQILRTRGDEEISINPDEMRTDLAAVLDALRDGRVEDALSGYRGELLRGLIPPESDGFMRWLDTERTRLKVSMCVTAIARVNDLERNGNITGALAIARQVIEIEPDDETVVRKLMSLREAMGDRAGALAAFEAYRARLATDFEAEPAPETMAIVTRLRAPAPPSGPKAVPEAKPARSAPSESAAPAALVDAATPLRKRPTWRPIAAAAALVVVAMVATFALSASRGARPLGIGTSTPLTFDEGLQVETSISPNGRLVAYAKGNTRVLHVMVQKIGGGPAWRLTEDSSAFELMPRWSPDNDQLLFLSHDNAYVSPSIGGTPRVVARGTAGDGNVRSASWSPAGDSIVIVRNDSLIVEPLVGSGGRLVAAARGRQLHSCVWSAQRPWIACVSGNWVAFESRLFGNEAPSAIVLFPAAGGAPIELTGSAFQHKSPSWSADGRFLWILSDRDGAPGESYAIPVGGDGRASGPFVRVGLNAESISLTENRLAYSVPVRRANIWSIPIPGDKQLALATAGARITSGTHLIELVHASADGKWLVYDSNLNGNADIYRIPAGGGAAERLTDDPRPEYAGTLSPDGRELAWQRWVNGERHLFVRRLDSDSAHEILPVPGDQGVPRWSPDGNSLAAWSHNKEAGAVFVMHRDARGGWARPAWRLEGGQLPVWSPDGRALAYVRHDGGIETIPVDSGARRQIYAPRPGTSDPIATYPAWGVDPTTIWFLGTDGRGQGGIWSVPANGGSARLRVNLDDPSGRLYGPSLTSDSSRFYFTLDERFSNVRWAELVSR